MSRTEFGYHKFINSFHLLSLSLAFNCGTLSAPSNGQVDDSVTTFGAEAVYVCNEGFNLLGDDRRTCSLTRQWSGMPPECQRKGLFCLLGLFLFLFCFFGGGGGEEEGGHIIICTALFQCHVGNTWGWG